MRRVLVPVFMAFCLLLTACGSAAKSRYEEFSQELAAKSEFGFTGDIRAEYQDKTAEFTIEYSRYEGGCTVTVVEPELIRGVTAHMADGKTQLEFSGVILDVGPLDEYGLTPMSALPTLVRAMQTGHLESIRSENGQTVVELKPEDHLTVTVWFEEETMTPVYAEIASEGRVAVYCDLRDWS